MRRFRLEKRGNRFELPGQAKELGRGGEATLYQLPTLPGLALKLYHQPTREHASKLAAMIAKPPDDPAPQGHRSIAWPIDRLLEDAGQAVCVGYAMPLVANARRIIDLYNPKARQQFFPHFQKKDLLGTARQLAAAVRAIHNQGHVIGDLNESNVLVDDQGHVTLVDTDSFQVLNQGRLNRCQVGSGHYTAPELQGQSFHTVDRIPAHDNFALAVLVFQLLMDGFHPHAGRFTGAGDPPSIQERIKTGHWPYSRKPGCPYKPSPHAPPWDSLHPRVQALLRQCFDEGHSQPGRRPDAGHWEEALLEAERAEGLTGPPRVKAPTAASPKKQLPPSLPVNKWLLAAAAVGVLAVASGVALIDSRRHSHRSNQRVDMPSPDRSSRANPNSTRETETGAPPSTRKEDLHERHPSTPNPPDDEGGGVPISPSEAGQHVGEKCTVQFPVRSARRAKSKPVVFLNSERSYRSPTNFTVMIGERALEGHKKKGIAPERDYLGKTVRVTGVVKLFEGRAEIVVNSTDQIETVDE